jgi:hypothetical protein
LVGWPVPWVFALMEEIDVSSYCNELFVVVGKAFYIDPCADDIEYAAAA